MLFFLVFLVLHYGESTEPQMLSIIGQTPSKINSKIAPLLQHPSQIKKGYQLIEQPSTPDHSEEASGIHLLLDNIQKAIEGQLETIHKHNNSDYDTAAAARIAIHEEFERLTSLDEQTKEEAAQNASHALSKEQEAQRNFDKASQTHVSLEDIAEEKASLFEDAQVEESRQKRLANAAEIAANDLTNTQINERYERACKDRQLVFKLRDLLEQLDSTNSWEPSENCELCSICDQFEV